MCKEQEENAFVCSQDHEPSESVQHFCASFKESSCFRAMWRGACIHMANAAIFSSRCFITALLNANIKKYQWKLPAPTLFSSQ